MNDHRNPRTGGPAGAGAASPAPAVRLGRRLPIAAAVLALAGCGSAPPEAADGTDLNACQDARCEVKLTGPAKLPLDPARFGTGTLEFTPRDDTVSFTLKQSGQSASSSLTVCHGEEGCIRLGGGARSSGGGGGSVTTSSSSTAREGTRITADKYVITVVWVGGGSAVLRVAPR